MYVLIFSDTMQLNKRGQTSAWRSRSVRGSATYDKLRENISSFNKWKMGCTLKLSRILTNTVAPQFVSAVVTCCGAPSAVVVYSCAGIIKYIVVSEWINTLCPIRRSQFGVFWSTRTRQNLDKIVLHLGSVRNVEILKTVHWDRMQKNTIGKETERKSLTYLQ